MSLSLSLLKYCIIILVSAYLGARYAPESKAPELPQVKQSQQASCKVIIKKIIQPDGAVSESSEFNAVSSQEQVVIPQKQKQNAIFGGFGTNLKGQLSYQNDKQLHQIQTDGNKDHVYFYNYKILEW
jgi:hypothetical protein